MLLLPCFFRSFLEGKAGHRLCRRRQQERRSATIPEHNLGRTAPQTPHAGARWRSSTTKEAFLPASVTARECPSYHAEVAARSPRRSQADEPEAPGARSAGPRPRRQPPRSRPNAAPRPARGSGRETRGRQAAHPRKGLPRGGAPACLCFLSASNHLIDFNSFMICMAI